MTVTHDVELARHAAAQVLDPEVPVLTIEDLGVLRAVELRGERVVVDITPTYSGCPAMDTIRDDVVLALTAAGFADVEVRFTHEVAPGIHGAVVKAIKPGRRP